MTDTASASPSPEHSDLSGRDLGDYRLLRRLGRGAMAEVYLAEQSSLRRQVAIKALRRELATDENYIRRFKNEAQSAAALVHANIVQIYEVGCVDGVHYIAQEYVPGMNLREFVTRNGPLEVVLSVSVMRQVAAALCKAAEQGIIHRDIKPENIMLAKSGEVKVADFGLARLASEADALRLTQIGMTMGTPLYMSPEQIEGRTLDSRSDIYSFGVTCYHMLSGQAPFRGDTALSVALQHVKAQPEPLDTLRPDLPISLVRIIHAMLAKEPKDRPADPRTLLRELRLLPIEGLPDEAIEPLMSEDLANAVTTARLAATERLATVMRTAAMTQPKPPSRVWWAVAGGCGLLLGVWLSWIRSEPSLLAAADPHRTHVVQQDSALAQYIFASTAHTEEAWLSVAEYFPEREFYVRLSRQQLARWYLQRGDLERAMALFEEFSNLNDAERKFRAFGLAGMCVLLSMQRQYEDSVRVLSQLIPIRDELDPDMGRLVAHAIQTNRNAMSEQSVGQWADWVESQLSAEEPIDGPALPDETAP